MRQGDGVWVWAGHGLRRNHARRRASERDSWAGSGTKGQSAGSRLRRAECDCQGACPRTAGHRPSVEGHSRATSGSLGGCADGRERVSKRTRSRVAVIRQPLTGKPGLGTVQNSRRDRVVPTWVTVFREGLACSRPERAPRRWSGERCAGGHSGDLARGPPSEPAQVWGSRGHCHQGSSPSVPPLQSTQGASSGTGSPEWATLVVGVEGGCVAPVLYGLGLGRSLRWEGSNWE